MVAEAPLDVAAAFTPFDDSETRRMRRYRDKAKELSECKLMSGPLTLNVFGGVKSGLTHEGSRADRSDLLMMFRPLYFAGQRDVSGFQKVAAMLRRHAEEKGGDAAAQAVEMIAEYEADHERALAEHGVFEVRVGGGSESISPKEMLRLFLHGGDFHMDARLADYLESLPPDTRHTFEFSYLLTVRQLGVLYCQFATFPNSILREPTLVAGDDTGDGGSD
jgi:hypothetical protein